MTKEVSHSSAPPAVELPPSFRYQLDWASGGEKEEILERMRASGRQTMNLRVMPEARLLRMRAPDDQNQVIGWAGFDTTFTTRFGEVFSLYVVPSYRTYLVGLVLETARCAYLKKSGVRRVLCRMESSTNTSLLRYRLREGLMVEAETAELPPELRSLCHRCELFGGACASQAYVWVDVDRFLDRGFGRLGFVVDFEPLPKVIEIDASRFRRVQRPLHPPGPALRGLGRR